MLPSFGGFFFTIAAFVVALSVIVAVHEYGHYIVGRWSGIHAEVFSIGFGPVLASRVDRRGTRWQIAALPFGGYVKFAGDADAASVTSAGREADAARRRQTMHGAPLWARSATVAAGPAFNFIMSILVFGGFFLVNGVAGDKALVGAISPIPATPQELRTGDRIVALQGIDTPDRLALLAAIDRLEPAPTLTYTVERNGVRQDILAPWPRQPLASAVQPQSAAREAGLRAGDVIVAVNDALVFSFDQVRDLVGESGGAPLSLTVWRDGRTFEASMTPRRVDLPLAEGGFETRWLIGITGGVFFEGQARTPGVLEAAQLGASQTWFIASTSLSGLWHMIQGAISSCNLRGPIGIAETSGAMASDGLASFIWFIAVLSTAVGLLNLFPIPILDGGHLLFHAWEAVTGRPPSDGALRVLMAIGLAFLATLMLFAIGNDLFCP